MKIAFDKDKYIKLQSENILKRIDKFGEKLYLEFGWKLFDDFHASRVLPWFLPHLKTELLENLKDKVEVIFTISATDIEKGKIRWDHWITYDQDLLRSIDKLKKKGLSINWVVITKFNNQSNINPFIKNLENHGIKVYKHHFIEDYPYNIEKILSDEWFWKNDYIETTKPIIVVTAPGPNSWKLSVCLSQIYNDSINGIKAWYAKFETFPIWNLNLKHPVNLAYEASTADIDDINMIDNFHLEAYWESAVNYNRDIEIFPILRKILANVFGSDVYKSPTDMWVNMAWYCITDEKLIEKACKSEIIRRYLNYKVDKKLGLTSTHTVEKTKLLMDYLGISVDDRKVVKAALEKQELCGCQSMAIEMPDWTIITWRTSELMTAPAATILNALKYLGNINDEIKLLSLNIWEPLLKFKKKVFKSDILTLNEILIALNIMAQTNNTSELALSKLNELNWLDAHSTYILNSLDQKVLKNLWVNYTSEDKFYSDKLYDEAI